MQQDIVELLISIEADCRAQFTPPAPSPSISLFLVLSLFSASQYTKLFEMLPKNCLRTATATWRRWAGQHQQPIHLPLTCHMPHGTRLCGTPININLSIKVIHYVALPHATRGNAPSTCSATSSPALSYLATSSVYSFFCGLPTSTNNKIFLGWAIKSLLLIAEGTNDLASA